MQPLATAHSQQPKHPDRGFLQGEGCARYEKLSNFSRVCEEEDLRELAGPYASQDPLKPAAGTRLQSASLCCSAGSHHPGLGGKPMLPVTH